MSILGGKIRVVVEDLVVQLFLTKIQIQRKKTFDFMFSFDGYD